MAYVPIPKYLKKVKTKVAFNLTKRQLIGFTIAGMICPLSLYFSSLFLKRTDLALRNTLSIFTFINFISHRKE